MGIWALIVDGKEIAQYRAVFDEDAAEGCEEEAIERGYAARLEHGFALVQGAEIVKLSD